MGITLESLYDIGQEVIAIMPYEKVRVKVVNVSWITFEGGFIYLVEDKNGCRFTIEENGLMNTE